MKSENIDSNKSSVVISRFKSIYVKSDYSCLNENGSKNLMWANYKPHEMRVIPIEEFKNINLPQNAYVFYYDERDEKLIHTTFFEICNLIDSLEPWDEIDAEIFDETMKWVITVTHEDFCFVHGLDC
jgi:hypothetical protein